MSDPTAGEALETRLAQLADARRDAMRLRAQLAHSTAAVEAADALVRERRRTLAVEQEDVDRLESFSLTRVLAAFGGSRDSALAKERAERNAARYAVSEAEERLAAALREREQVQDRLVNLGDLDAHWEQALSDRERWITATAEPGAGAVADLAQRRGEVDAELREADEALAAARFAATELEQAAKVLGHADDWSAADTWFGGGMITSMVKHDRLDAAAAHLRRVDAALARLDREMADLGRSTVAPLDIDAWDRTFDVFFDNIFTDFAVRSRIRDAIDRVARARQKMATLTTELTTLRARLAETAVDLATERRRLLT